MNDEIKEILNKLQYGFCSQLTYEKLLDYITNLQQENESLKEDRKYLLEYNNEDYKSRCEKAAEKIKKHLYDKKFLNHIYTDEQMLNIVSNILDGKE